jgi:GntR family transcriptional regulator, transcriptional repressor for pyruvate dehydrogenase complex
MSEEKRINFGTFETEVLPDQIIDRILELIKSKQLQPGDKLPPERELAEMMQVGRQTLRAALRALSAMDVIDIRRSSGAYITDLKPNTFIERLEFMFRMSEASISELFEARSALEVTIIRLAASRMTAEEFEQLQANTNRIDEQLDSTISFSKVDLEFHRMLYQFSRNSILAQFADVILKLGLETRLKTGESLEARQRATRDHQAIVAALATRDPDVAANAMLAHMNTAKSSLEQLFTRTDPERFEA